MSAVVRAGFTLAVTMLFTIGLYSSMQWSFKAGLFPWTIGIPALLLCLIQLFLDLRKALKPAAQPLLDDDEGIMDLRADRDIEPGIVARRAAGIFAWIFGLFAAVWLLGFLISMPLFVLLYLRFQSRETWRLSLGWTGATIAFVIGLFHYVLRVPWPSPVFDWLQNNLLEWI